MNDDDSNENKRFGGKETRKAKKNEKAADR